MGVIGWDSNPKGELLAGYQGTDQLVPVASTLAPSNTVEVAAGYHFSIVRDKDGNLYSLGDNEQGELGLGDNMTRKFMTKIVLPEPAVEVKAEAAHAVARLQSGKIAGWGTNFSGQIGDGAPTDPREIGYGQNTPLILDLGQPVISIANGGGSVAVVLTDGTARAWGDNSSGQLGLGDNTDRHTPQVVPIPGTAKKVAMGGGAHGVVTLWLMKDGTVYGSGFGRAGQLGGTENVTKLVKLPVTGAVDIAAALSHTLILDKNGKVWSFGTNENGELGRTGANPVPLDNVTSLGLGFKTTALIAGGKIYTAGITNGREADEAVLAPLDGITGATQVDISEYHGLAICDPIPPVRFAATNVVGGADLEWDAPPGTEKWSISTRPVVKPKKAKWGPVVVKLEPSARKYPLRGLISGKAYEVQLINHAYKNHIVNVKPL